MAKQSATKNPTADQRWMEGRRKKAVLKRERGPRRERIPDAELAMELRVLRHDDLLYEAVARLLERSK